MQKQIKDHEGNRYIEADPYDYAVAYSAGIRIIAATLDQISERARAVLRVCCELTDDLKKNNQSTVMTVNQIIDKAPLLGVEFSNRQDVYKQLDELVECEYLSLDRKGYNGRKYYTVIFRYARNDEGEIINIGTPKIKEMITPDELREKLQTH